MRKLLLFILMLMTSTISVFPQAFSKIPVEKKDKEAVFSLNNEKCRAIFDVNKDTRRPKITFTSKNTYFTYNSIFQDSQLDFDIFSNPKSNVSYLLINNYFDMTRGADLYVIEKNQFKYVGNLNVGAYTKVGGERMNYNSILPYLSIVYTTQKTYFSFEVPLVVLNPGQQDEQILEGNKIHYTLTGEKLEQNFTK